jgi:hypothetical protein
MIRRSFLSRLSILSTVFSTGMSDTRGAQKRIDVGAYQCLRCDTLNYVHFPNQTVAEPDICRECEKDGPYRLTFDDSTFKTICVFITSV